MDYVNKIILTLEKEEVREFKYYAHRMNSSEERKDIILFDYIRKSKNEFDENYIFGILYHGKSENKNTYARLKNRLVNDIYKWISLSNSENGNENEILNSIIICDFLSQKKLYEIALRELKKAEKKASENSLPDILDLVYTNMLRIAEYVPEINVNTIIEKRKQNFSNIQKLREIDDLVSSITYRIRTTQNFDNAIHSGVAELEKIIDQNNNFANNDIPAIKIKIYEAVSKMLLQKHEYEKLEKYLIPTYEQFEKDKIFNKERHPLKLQMLIYLANALFKNKKYTQSLDIAPKIHDALLAYDKMYYDRYLFFYYNILVINYSEINYKKALETLAEIKDDDNIIQSNFYNFVLLNLALLYFIDKNYKNSIKNLLLLYKNKIYLSSSVPFKLRVEIFELIVRYELKDFESVTYRTKQIENDYSELLTLKENERYKNLIAIIEKMAETPEADIKQNSKINKLSASFLSNTIEYKQKDSEIIDYENWLKNKLNK